MDPRMLDGIGALLLFGAVGCMMIGGAVALVIKALW